MNALALMATLGLDTSNYEQGLKGAGGMAQSFASSFKKVLGGVAVAGGAAVTAAGAAVVSVVKSAVTAYKEFEQLEGGAALIFGKKGTFEEFASGASESLYQTGQRGEEVRKLQEEINALLGDGEKLVVDGIYGPKTRAALDQYANKLSSVQKSYETQGSAYDFMMSRADEAYKNVQMSASEYMAQVVGLGAGLKQSLGGDAQAAAELADKIITAEADVVAATGRPMEAVQNAFNGVLRGNYSMLDNLGIGIKASKDGMKDVIDTVNDWNKAQGKATKYRQGNLADEQAALVDYIEMVGYAGYAEHEALGTLEGSFAATKASWKDMLVEFGRGGDIKKAMGKLATAGKAAVTNLIPVVKNALTSIGTFVGEVAPVISRELPGLITEVAPAFLNAAGSLIGSFVTSIPAMLGGIGGAIKTAITGDKDADWSEVGEVIYNGIIGGVTGIGGEIKKLITGSDEVNWTDVGSTILGGITDAVNTAKGTLTGLFAQASLDITNLPWASAGAWIGSTITGAITGIREFFVNTFSDAKDGAENGVSWSDLGSSISGFIEAGLGGIGETISGFLSSFNITSVSLDLFAIAGSIVGTLTEFLSSLSGSLLNAGDSIVGNIIDGISSQVPILEGHTSTIKTTLMSIARAVIITKAMIAGANLASAFSNVLDASKLVVVKKVAEISAALEKLMASPVFGPAFALWASGEIMGRISENEAHTFDQIHDVAENAEERIKSLHSEEAKQIADIQAAFSKVVDSDDLYNGSDEGENPLFGLFKQYGDQLEEMLPDLDVWDKIKENAQNAIDESGGIDWSALFENFDSTGFTSYDFLDFTKEIVAAMEGAIEQAETTTADKAKARAEEKVTKLLQEAESAVAEYGASLAKAGEEGASSTKTSVESGIAEGGASGASAMGDSMETEGARAVSAIQNLLNSLRFPSFELYHDDSPTLKKPTLGFSFAKTLHASAMNHGEILRGLTPFGVDGNGTVHYGGEAGAEAVVGVNSLDSMIQKAVSNAMAGVLGKMDELRAGQGRDMQLVLDSGELVGGIANKMNRRLGSISRWREGGHA